MGHNRHTALPQRSLPRALAPAVARHASLATARIVTAGIPVLIALAVAVPLSLTLAVAITALGGRIEPGR